jgi:DNA-binding NarL/FixJ family response regulator
MLAPSDSLLVDDDALVRAGLRMILSSSDELEVVGEAAEEAMLSPSVTRTLLSHLGDDEMTDRRRFAAPRLRHPCS